MKAANEGEPAAWRIEEQVLLRLGLEELLDKPVQVGNQEVGATGANFLDAYPAGSSHREQTEDILTEFAAMSTSDPDYQQTKDYILSWLRASFEPAQQGS